MSHGHCFVILNARPFVPTLPILSPSNVPCTHSHWFVLFFIFLSLNNDRVNCLSVISGGSSFRFNTTPATTWTFEYENWFKFSRFLKYLSLIFRQERLHWYKSTWLSRLQKYYHLKQYYQFCFVSGTQFVILRVPGSDLNMRSFAPYLYPFQCPGSCQFLWVTDIMSGIHYLNDRFGRLHPAKSGWQLSLWSIWWRFLSTWIFDSFISWAD